MEVDEATVGILPPEPVLRLDPVDVVGAVLLAEVSPEVVVVIVVVIVDQETELADRHQVGPRAVPVVLGNAVLQGGFKIHFGMALPANLEQLMGKFLLTHKPLKGNP